jgi:RNA polymerase sigma-70 factor (ECF subfamily)
MSPVVAFKPAIAPLGEELEALFREHSRLVYRTAFSVTGSAQDAEDVVQTLFLQLLRHGLPPGLKNNPKGYLYRAAVNSALNAVKSRRRRHAAADAAGRELPTLVPAAPDVPDPDTERQQQLVEAIATLRPRAVEMLILRYEHDYSDADIARLLGTSRSVVAVTLFRARGRLRKLLQASGEEL